MAQKRKASTKDVRRKRFLDAYRQTGNITAAAKMANVQRTSHYRWLQESEGYEEQFLAAQEEAMDLLEIEARRRAIEGTDKPIFYQGLEVARVKECSDTLLIFLLKAARPEKYRERYGIDVKGKLEHECKVHVYLPANQRHDSNANE